MLPKVAFSRRSRPRDSARSLNAIFASFYQERVYADRQEVGVGLGLAIVKRFADGLHYTLRVQSCEGHGSVFKVLLPAHPVEPRR